jgi:hypothetical protein
MAQRFRRIALVLTVGLTACVGLAAGDGPRAWIAFTSHEGQFSIEMPTEPQLSERHTRSFIGTVSDHIITAWSEDERFTVEYTNLPHVAVLFAGPDTIYDHAKGALLKQTLGKTVSWLDTALGGHEGKRLVYDLPPMPGKPKMYGEAELFLVVDRLYVIDATVPAGAAEARARRFLDSLQIE